MMRRHLRWSSRIDAYVDGELTALDHRAVGAHLAECWMCSTRAETARLIKASLARRTARRPSELARARLRQFALQLSPPRPAGPA